MDMKKKIKDLTLKELLKFRINCKKSCDNCPFHVFYNYECSLHDLQSSMTIRKLESEVEVDE